MTQSYSLSVVLPVYNERDNIKKTVEDSVGFLSAQNIFEQYEIILVDDGSYDGTVEILKNLVVCNNYIRLVTHSKNLGYGRALVSGIKVANFPWVLLMDADGQFKLSSIKDFAEYLMEYDMVVGYRNKRRDSSYRVLLGKIYTFFTCIFFGLKLKDVNCGFKLFKKDILKFNDAICHAGAFYTNIFIKAKTHQYKIKEIPVEHFLRATGRQTGANFNVIVEATMDLLRLRFLKIKKE